MVEREVCMAFAALDALREGYEVYPEGHSLRRGLKTPSLLGERPRAIPRSCDLSGG